MALVAENLMLYIKAYDILDGAESWKILLSKLNLD